MTAKEAFRLADSIMRYRDTYTEDYLIDCAPALFDAGRDYRTEAEAIPEWIIGTVFKYHMGYGNWSPLRGYEGRIMRMYKDKLHDRDLLARGWHVGRSHGYGIVAGKIVSKRVPLVSIRMT